MFDANHGASADGELKSDRWMEGLRRTDSESSKEVERTISSPGSRRSHFCVHWLL